MKTYTVVGANAVRGHRPGVTFEEEIPERQVNRLIRSGALEEKVGKPRTGKGGGKATAVDTEPADAGETSDASGDDNTKEE